MVRPPLFYAAFPIYRVRLNHTIIENVTRKAAARPSSNGGSARRSSRFPPSETPPLPGAFGVVKLGEVPARRAEERAEGGGDGAGGRGLSPRRIGGFPGGKKSLTKGGVPITLRGF